MSALARTCVAAVCGNYQKQEFLGVTVLKNLQVAPRPRMAVPSPDEHQPMTQRKLIKIHKLPPGSNPAALAESLTDDFNIASITGRAGEVEIELVHPPELVVVIDAARARFFVVPVLEDDDDDDKDEEDDPHAIAEEMAFFLARKTGQMLDDEDDEEDAKTPEDDSDDVARRVVKRLLEEGLLELVTPRSQTSVEEYLAHQIAQGKTGDSLCDDLTEVKGVAELYASNEQLAEILAECSRKRVVRTAREDIPPLVARLKSLLNAESDAPAKPPLKMPAKAPAKSAAPSAAPAPTKTTKKVAKKASPDASPPRKRKS